MTELTITLTDIANGGLAMGRDKRGRPIFVPYAIPGETVRVRIIKQGPRYARGELVEVIKPAADRVKPRCRHFGVCGGCHFQHIAYEAQPLLKYDVVVDQLKRVGGVKKPSVEPVVAAEQPYEFAHETTLFPADPGGLGYWSPAEHRIIPIKECPILHPRLQEALADLDVELPGLRKLTLRLDDDGELLAAIEVDGVEPPELKADFPISVAIVLPDRTAASLIGDPWSLVEVRDRPFRVSPGVALPPGTATEPLIEAVLDLAQLQPTNTVLQTPGGAGWLTAFLAEQAAEMIVVEPNPDAVADAAVNLDEFDNIAIYEGPTADILPELTVEPDVVVAQLAGGRTPDSLEALAQMRPKRMIVLGEIGDVSQNVKGLRKAGYRLAAVRPVDARPQGFQVEVVTLFVGQTED